MIFARCMVCGWSGLHEANGPSGLSPEGCPVDAAKTVRCDSIRDVAEAFRQDMERANLVKMRAHVDENRRAIRFDIGPNDERGVWIAFETLARDPHSAGRAVAAHFNRMELP